jgi:hypothetical protein
VFTKGNERGAGKTRGGAQRVDISGYDAVGRSLWAGTGIRFGNAGSGKVSIAWPELEAGGVRSDVRCYT